jgi:acetolactate synthase small subunit
MPTIVTIGGAGKSGALFKISTFLARKGYGIKGHEITGPTPDRTLLKFTLAVSKLAKEQLAAEIKRLDPDFNVLDVAVVEGTPGDAGKIPRIGK